MLNRLHNNIFIVGMLVIVLLGALAVNRAFCLMSLGTLLAFTSQLGVLIFFSRGNVKAFSETMLFWTVLLYSVCIGALFMLISYFYEGDTFMFSKADAWFYYVNSMKTKTIGLFANFKRMMALYDFDDFGALFFDSALMAIYPSKFLLNAVYVFTGALSSVMLFRIGRTFMPEGYAYIASLAYGTSSFLVFFHCTFLKESIFVFLVIAAVYFFFQAFVEGRLFSFFWTVLMLVLILFFRPAVSAMLVAAFGAYFAVTSRPGSAQSFFLYGFVGLVLLYSFSTIMEMADTYTGGDLGAMVDYGTVEGYSSSFSLFVSSFAAPFGPFPTLFPKEVGEPITINFYGAGLVYRMFLILPMWLGIYYCFRRMEKRAIMLSVFILLGMVGTAFVMASLELRKVMTHIPFTFLLAFYGLYRWKERGDKRMPEYFFHGFAIGILVLWTLVRG